MKKFKLLSVLMVLLAAAGFVSCESEPLDNNLLSNVEPGGGNNNAPASFTVQFNGNTYTATTTQAQVQGTNMSIIGARGTAGEIINLTIPGGIVAGTYTDAVMMYVPSAAAGGFFSNRDVETGESNGSVRITSINTARKTVSGTFSFTGHYMDPEQNLPTAAFTNGTFTNIPYTGTIPGGGGPGEEPGDDEEYFNATIEGQATEFTTFLTNPQMGMLQLVGSGEGRTIQLVINQNVTPGTYALGAGIPSGMVTIDSNMYMSTGGSIVIQSNTDGWIKGTFQFNAVNPITPGTTVSVTAGSFNLEY